MPRRARIAVVRGDRVFFEIREDIRQRRAAEDVGHAVRKRAERRLVIGAPWWKALVRVVEVVQPQADLLEVVDSLPTKGGFAR